MERGRTRSKYNEREREKERELGQKASVRSTEFFPKIIKYWNRVGGSWGWADACVYTTGLKHPSVKGHKIKDKKKYMFYIFIIFLYSPGRGILIKLNHMTSAG